MDRFDLTGRVAVVTGAASGIGRAISQGLAESGAHVVVADIVEEGGREFVNELTRQRHHALAVATDARSPESVAAMLDTTVREFGRVDVLVNNVGGSVGPDAPSQDVSLTHWEATLSQTATSTFLCSKAVAPLMISHGGGRIINLASVYGIVAHDPRLYDNAPSGAAREQLAYATAKGGVIAMTRSLAMYWARHRINVNAIAPGLVRTPATSAQTTETTWRRLADRTPLGRIATPDDMAGAAVFLASDAAQFVTGQVIVVDGGWVLP